MRRPIAATGDFSPAFLHSVTIPVKEQLLTFFLAFLSGASFALVYDRFAALRRRCSSRITAAVLDGVYCLCVAVALFLATMNLGNGRPRIYLLLAIVLGAVTYFMLPAAFFRPVWNFWLDCFLLALSFWNAPRRFLLRCFGKVRKKCKKLFYFSEKYAIMLFCKPRNTKETRHGQSKSHKKEKPCEGQPSH